MVVLKLISKNLNLIITTDQMINDQNSRPKLTDKPEAQLKIGANMEQKSIEYANKDLKPKIENHFACFNFVRFNRRLYL